MSPAEREEILNAWVDGQVDDGDPRVRALRDDRAFAAAAARLRDQNASLRDAFSRELDEPVPVALVLAALGGATPGSSGGAGARGREPGARGGARAWGRPLALAASIVVAVAAGATAGWIGRGEYAGATIASESAPREPLARAAAIAYAAYAPEVRHPVEVGADERDHLAGWLSKRLGTRLAVPSLDAVGFRLVGGRLLPDDGSGVAAMFMFEDADGRRLTMLVRRDAPGTDTAFRVSDRDGVATFHWLDRGFGYALSGRLPRETMLAAATAVYRQLNP